MCLFLSTLVPSLSNDVGEEQNERGNILKPGEIVLKGITTLTGRAQFGLIYERGRSWTSREVVVRALPNSLGITRYGLTVSRRIGKAVIRNKIKRRLREIIRKTGLKPGWDIVIIARNTAASADFATLGRSVDNLLMKAGLTAGEDEANSAGAD